MPRNPNKSLEKDIVYLSLQSSIEADPNSARKIRLNLQAGEARSHRRRYDFQKGYCEYKETCRIIGRNRGIILIYEYQLK